MRVLLLLVRLLPGIFILLGCQSQIERQPSLESAAIIDIEGFSILTLAQLHPANQVYIYIEGDGQPWVGNNIASDPGPFNLVALSLMHKDKSASFYLGRPCYFQHLIKTTRNCDPAIWTRARYSKKVVSIMVDALMSSSALATYNEWILVGHSGGGTLAYLMAQDLPKVKQVIAISSNLNVDAWIKYHQFTPVDQSLDPAKLQNTKPVQLIYLAGGKDNNVPLTLNQTFLDQQGASILFRPDYDHNCCWIKEWPELLESIRIQSNTL